MDFNTKLVKESVAQIGTLLSDLVVAHMQEEDGVGIGEIEQGMRQILQAVGRQALGQILEKSDPVAPSIRCQCQHKANYRCRREGMVITVFGRVRYKRSYYLCDHCKTGEKPLDRTFKIRPGEMSQGLKPLLALLGIQTSFDEAASLAKRLLLLEISDNSIRKAAQWVGQKQEAIEEKWKKLSDWHHYMNDPTRQAEKAPDGCMGRLMGRWCPHKRSGVN